MVVVFTFPSFIPIVFVSVSQLLTNYVLCFGGIDLLCRIELVRQRISAQLYRCNEFDSLFRALRLCPYCRCTPYFYCTAYKRTMLKTTSHFVQLISVFGGNMVNDLQERTCEWCPRTRKKNLQVVGTLALSCDGTCTVCPIKWDGIELGVLSLCTSVCVSFVLRAQCFHSDPFLERIVWSSFDWLTEWQAYDSYVAARLRHCWLDVSWRD